MPPLVEAFSEDAENPLCPCVGGGQVGIGGVVKLADFGELGRLGGAQAQLADACSAPEVLRKVPPPPSSPLPRHPAPPPPEVLQMPHPPPVTYTQTSRTPSCPCHAQTSLSPPTSSAGCPAAPHLTTLGTRDPPPLPLAHRASPPPPPHSLSEMRSDGGRLGGRGAGAMSEVWRDVWGG